MTVPGSNQFRPTSGGAVLGVANGTGSLATLSRINYCLLAGRQEMLMYLAADFEKNNRRFRRWLRGVPTVYPRRIPSGALFGFLHRYKDHSLPIIDVCSIEERWMVDMARRRSHRRGNAVSLVLEFLAPWSGHTPSTLRLRKLLRETFPEPVLQIGAIEIPREADLRENIRDAGSSYPDCDALGLDGLIITERPASDIESAMQDWYVAWGLAVLIGSRRANVVRQTSGANALAPLARFTKGHNGGFIHAAFGSERIPLLGWPFPWGPFSRISRAPLPSEVGSALAEAIRAAQRDGANPDHSWVMAVGVPLRRGSALWREGFLPTMAKRYAADQLSLPAFPTNIDIVWSTLMTSPDYDNHHLPISAMVLYPSPTSPEPLLAKYRADPDLAADSGHRSRNEGSPTRRSRRTSTNGHQDDPIPDQLHV